MPRLRLNFLGGFEARIGSGVLLDIANKKTRALLAYLALPAGRAHSRDKLAGLLWSDRGDEQARNSLRQALTELGRVLAAVRPLPLVKARDSLALDPEAVEVDAVLFERLAASEAADDLRHATRLYGGELLDGLAIRDSAFEEWLRRERQRSADLAVVTLKKVVPLESGADALAAAQRLVALAPLQEDSHRLLMRLHGEHGDVAAALRQYEACRKMLKDELGLNPSAETEALRRSLHDHTGPGAPQLAAGESTSGETPSRLSIAVLPFRNLSDDSAQGYLSDGIAEDIITELSRYRELMVIARNSSFRFRDPSVDMKRVGQELGAEYLLEGSVRKFGDRLRIAAQLIETSSGSHLWAERYDRDVKEIFDIQDDVTQTIAATLVGQVVRSRADRSRRTPTTSWKAYDYVLQGLQCINRYDPKRAETFLRKAVEIDPEYAQAHALLAASYLFQYWQGIERPLLASSLASAKKAVLLDGDNPWGHCLMGAVLIFMEELDAAEKHLDRAVLLNPNSVWCAAWRVAWLNRVGRTKESLETLDKLVRLDPFLPDGYWELRLNALFAEHRYEEAIRAAHRKETLQYYDHAYVAAAYAYLGLRREAEAEVAQVLLKRPDFSIRWYAQQEPYKFQADRDHLLDGMRRAGLPE
jgi:TolB-like protein/DNA-binding SARP family transcriptional activator/Flp pilus assembly protein TadD